VNAEEPLFVREVARTDDPKFGLGHVKGHTARRFMDGWDPAFTDPFLVLGEDWMPRGAYKRHPHRGMETVTFVIEWE
jgi:quercetin 2,3-dioxygenase